MIEKKRVSIVTVLYNGMDFIYETINSVLQQDYANIEFVIADDSSKHFDKNSIISYIEEHKGDNLRNYLVYQNQKNLGTVKNFNQAISKVTGDIVIILSGDDIFFNHRVVSVIVEKFQNNKIDFLVTRRKVMNIDGTKTDELIPSDFEIQMIKKFKTAKQEYAAMYTGDMYSMASGSVFSFRKQLFEKLGGYDESYRLWEDGPFVAKYLSEIGMVEYDYDIISIYYRKGGVSENNCINPLLLNDLKNFLQNGMKDPLIKGFDARKLKYRYYHDIVCEQNKRQNLFKYRICYIDVIIHKAFLWFRSKLYNRKIY